MATLDQDITEAWIDIKSELSLVDGKRYIFQSRGSAYTYFEGAEPASDEFGVHMKDLEKIGVVPEAGVSIWVRSEGSVKGRIFVNDGA